MLIYHRCICSTLVNLVRMNQHVGRKHGTTGDEVPIVFYPCPYQDCMLWEITSTRAKRAKTATTDSTSVAASCSIHLTSWSTLGRECSTSGENVSTMITSSSIDFVFFVVSRLKNARDTSRRCVSSVWEISVFA